MVLALLVPIKVQVHDSNATAARGTVDNPGEALVGRVVSRVAGTLEHTGITPNVHGGGICVCEKERKEGTGEGSE